MSHEYMKCKGCREPFMEHLMNHTEKGSYCDSCYKSLGLEKSDEDLGLKVCTKCGKKFLQRNFKTSFPDDVCGICGKEMETKTETTSEVRDVPFYTEENQGRDIVLGFIHDRADKRVGLRVLNRTTNTVHPQSIPEELRTWNLNIKHGTLDGKCCDLGDFPVLALSAGVEGNPLAPDAKLISKVSGAWILEEVAENTLRLVSVSGQTKDVTEVTALSFHTKFNIANAKVENGKLTGKYKKFEKDFGTDVFTIHDDGHVQWVYYNPDGNDGNGQYVVNNFGAAAIKLASNTKVVKEFFDILGSEAKQFLIDNDGNEEFEATRVSVTTEKFALTGCNKDTMKALKALTKSDSAKTKPSATTTEPKATKSNSNEDKFFLDQATGQIEWISKDKDSGALFVGMFNVQHTGGLLDISLPTDVYFEKLQAGVVKSKDSRKFFLSDGDGDYTMALDRYITGEYTLAGKTDATKKALIAFAEGVVGAKAGVKKGTKKGSKKGSESLSDKVNTLPDQADLDRMKTLNDDLKAASEAYYEDDDSDIDNIEYDEKFDELLALEAKTGVTLPDSVTQDVGTEVKGKLPKVQHAEKLLSLDKTKEVGALQDLLGQDPNGDVGTMSWKMDGLTILATYDGGVLKQAVTRGNGKIGEDVTHNAKFFKGMPRRIPYKGEIRVRGEAVIAYSTFERINAELPDGQEPYKNPRNLASGMVRRSEVTKDGSVEFFPFGVVVTDPKFKPTIYSQSLKFLLSQGFIPVESRPCIAENIESVVENFKKKIETFDYPTDGLVLAIDDITVQEKLGTTGHHPKGAIAFKWADEKQQTTLRSILWSASRTGVLTPVALFDPVELEGTTVKRASVHNLSMVRKLKLGIGDTISVYKANMIIPQIAENHTGSDTAYAPKVCPICGGATAIRVDTNSKTKGEPSEFVICTNPECTAKNIKGLAHFVKREAMNIDGVAEKTVQELVAEGFIHSALDFYTLKEHPEIAELPNWGKSSYNKLIYAVDTSRTTTLPQVIYSLGIKNVGRSASESIAKYFSTDEIAKALGGDGNTNGSDLFVKVMTDTDNPHIADGMLSEIDGVGQTMRADIIAYFKANKDFVTKLVSLLTIDSTGTSRKALVLPSNVPQGAPNCLDGLAFCVTGKIEFEGARDALHGYIESLGGKAVSAVSKSTNYLITNTPNSGSSKNKKAQDVGCQVISEASFFTLVKDLSEKAVATATPVVSDVEPTMTQGEQIVQNMIDSVEIPEDPRDARIQAAETIQALSGVPLAGLTFCVTGKVDYGTRSDLHFFIKRKGGEVAERVTKGVDYLITNDADSGSIKNKKAEALGARVISERDFMQMANK